MKSRKVMIKTSLGRVICQVILARRFKSGHMRVRMASNDVEMIKVSE